MGKENSESADATIARDTNVFIADTFSAQNKNQLKDRSILFLELKNNKNTVEDFRAILKALSIPNA